MKDVLKYIGTTVIIIFFVVVGYEVATHKGNKSGIIKKQQILLGTIVEIQVRNAEEEKTNAAMTEAFSEIKRIDSLFSTYIMNSRVWKINQTRDTLVTVLPEIYNLIQRCDSVNKVTAGNFDISVEALVKTWGFDTDHPCLPVKSKIDSSLKFIGWKNITLIGDGQILKRNSVKLNFGAVIPGYAADRALEVLKKNGIHEALVNAGGEIRGIGSGWSIGIQNPRRALEIISKIDLSGMAVATSGDYEQYFEKDGKRYHHIFNPFTGYPANGCMSVTVIAKDGFWADALSTGVFVLGPDKGMKLIEELKDTEGMIIDSSGKVKISSGFNKYVRR